MLLGTFFKILQSDRDEQNFRVEVAVDAQHPIFKGHFPHLPVVPGVCQTQMLMETLSHLLQRNVEIKRAHHIKFLALLNPEKVERLMMDIKIEKEEGNELYISATYSTPEEIFFRFKGEVH
ncbi:MAG: hypothetical protein IPP77_14080 [Bacteroidetes bacterium]|nr:hypothetical protein [Bacteroidota bacterium]